MPDRERQDAKSGPAARVARRAAQAVALVRGLPSIAAPRARRRPGEAPRLRFVYREIGAPARYRVQHQIEQARLAGLAAQDCPLDGALNPYDLAACDLLYLYRLELTPRTWPLLVAARRRGIPVVFDSDDLVWDLAERRYGYLDDHYSPRVVRRILRTIRWTRSLMRRVDALVFSTPYLARLAAGASAQPAYVNPNAISEQQLRAAEDARRRAAGPDDQVVVIGYFAGHPVHDEDLLSVAPALCAALDRFPRARFRTYGSVRLAGPLADPRYAARVEQRPLVGWDELPAHIAGVEINIAPLIDNPQRRAKSAVKYMEAALVEVPTVAASLEPYQEAIAHGRSGLLAAGVEEWTAALARLIESDALRRELGRAARGDVLARHTTAARAANFGAIVAQVLR